MCSLVSAVGANLYCDELALESVPFRPSFWKRYVDDKCYILRKGDVDGLLHHLHPTIKFTMELEEGMSLPFLDTKVTTRKEDGKLHTQNRHTRTGTYTLGITIQHL